jgi:hypothetical protein
MECLFTDYEKTVSLFGFKLLNFYAIFLENIFNDLSYFFMRRQFKTCAQMEAINTA